MLAFPMGRARSSGSFGFNVTYPDPVTTMPADIEFAKEAGERIEQAFALCAFASELVGEANERRPSIHRESSKRWIGTELTTSPSEHGQSSRTVMSEQLPMLIS